MKKKIHILAELPIEYYTQIVNHIPCLGTDDTLVLFDEDLESLYGEIQDTRVDAIKTCIVLTLEV